MSHNCVPELTGCWDEKVEMWNKRLDKRGGQEGDRRGRGGGACLLLAIDGSKRKWSENEFCTLSFCFHILIQNISCQKMTFSSVFVPWNSSTLPYSSEDTLLFVVVTSHISKRARKSKPITPSNFFNNPCCPSGPFNFTHIKCNTSNVVFHLFLFLLPSSTETLNTDRGLQYGHIPLYIYRGERYSDHLLK